MLVSRAAVLFALLSAGAPAFTPAFAHAILVDSQPAIRSTVAAGETAITLRFNSRIDRSRSALSLLAPGIRPQRLTIDANGRPDVMTAHATLRPGENVLRWQVLAIDGHITRGDVPVTAEDAR